MKQKMLALILTMCVTFSMMTGCSKAQEAPDKAPENQTAESEEAKTNGQESEKAEGDYPVIRMAYIMVGDTSMETEVEEKLNTILREKAKAEVDLIGLEFGNLTTQMNLMLTGGEESIDLFNSFWYASASSLVANGQIRALDDLIDINGAEVLKQFEGYEDYLDCGRINGSLYGIPTIYAWSSENIYLVNREAVEAANVDLSRVNDINSLTEALIQMKTAQPDGYFIPGSTETYWVPKGIDYLGDTNYLGVLTDPTNSTTVENYYESEYFLNLLENVKVWKEKGIISPDPMSNSNPTLVNLQYGVVEGTTGYNWDTEAGISSTSVQYGLDLDGCALSEALATTGDVTTYMWHISSFCKEPEAAMRILNVLYSDAEAAKYVGMGIEGKNYTLDENNQMVIPEGKTLFDAGWGCAGSAIWPNVMLCNTWNYESADIYEQMKEKNKEARKSLALGFLFDTTPVADQVAACANVVAQYYTALMYAEADIDETLPVFQEQLKSAGIDDIIKEKQSQLDAWLVSRKTVG